MRAIAPLHFICESCALFMRPTSTDSSKINFKTGSHDTIHTFKNYFAIVFLVFSNKQYPNRFSMLCVIIIDYMYRF